MPTAVAFTNGSRVRIEGREAVNLSTGLRALLLEFRPWYLCLMRQHVTRSGLSSLLLSAHR